MFPITMSFTVQDAAQLAIFSNAMSAATGGKVAISAEKPKSEVKADTAKKPAATENADTRSTAAKTDAQDKKADNSAEKSEVKVMTADERGVVVKAAIAKVGRDEVVALLASYGVKKASEIEDAGKLAEFDVKLNALAA